MSDRRAITNLAVGLAIKFGCRKVRDRDKLRLALRARLLGDGTQSEREIARAFGVNRQTLQRLSARIEAEVPDEVRRVFGLEAA